MNAFAVIVIAGLLSVTMQAQGHPSASLDGKDQAPDATAANRRDEQKEAIKRHLRDLADDYYAHPESAAASQRWLEVGLEHQSEAAEAWQYLTQRAESDVREHPDSAEAWHRIGRLNVRGSDREKAKKAFEKATALKPDYAEAYNGLGLYYEAPSWCGNTYGAWSNQERDFFYGKAVENQQKAIQLKPDYAAAYAALGRVYSSWHRNEKAAMAFRQAIRLDPGDKDSYWRLGNALQASGHDQEAIAIFELVIQQNADAELNRGSRRSDMGRVYWSAAHRSLAELYRRTENYRQALETYRRIQQAGIYFTIDLRLGLGLTYAGLGDKAAAMEEYQAVERAIQGKPEGVWKMQLQKELAELKAKLQRLP